jgi:hypothetical protein
VFLLPGEDTAGAASNKSEKHEAGAKYIAACGHGAESPRLPVCISTLDGLELRHLYWQARNIFLIASPRIHACGALALI